MSLEFLQPLEEKVERAAEEIATLRGRGTELEERVAELEQALAAAVDGAPKTAAPSDWEREREELRARVAALVERLETLLGG